MPGITLEEAERQLAFWLAASEDASKVHAYTIGDQEFEGPDAREIRNNIKYWQQQIALLTRRTTSITLVPTKGL